MPDTQQSTENTLRITERRARARALVTPPIYVNVDNGNGGLVFNLSEDGLALSAAMILAGDSFSNMRIHLPDAKGWIEANGQIAWNAIRWSARRGARANQELACRGNFSRRTSAGVRDTPQSGTAPIGRCSDNDANDTAPGTSELQRGGGKVHAGGDARGRSLRFSG